jgi:hypothetical protein
VHLVECRQWCEVEHAAVIHARVPVAVLIGGPGGPRAADATATTPSIRVATDTTSSTAGSESTTTAQ